MKYTAASVVLVSGLLFLGTALAGDYLMAGMALGVFALGIDWAAWAWGSP